MRKQLFYLTAVAIVMIAHVSFGSSKDTCMTMTTANLTMKIALKGAGDAVINWGDGTSDTVIIQKDYKDGWYNRLYSKSSERTITITGNNVIGLICSGNQLTGLDVSNNPVLTELLCGYNRLGGLDVSNNPVLTALNCGNNRLTSLDVSRNTALKELGCYNNRLTGLDISQNTVLEGLRCQNNRLTSLDVSQNTALKRLSCGRTQLTDLDISRNTALEDLVCGINPLISLNTGNNTALIRLLCDSCQLKILDLSQNIKLRNLNCKANQLTGLDVSNVKALRILNCSSNQLTGLNVNNNPALTTLHCEHNQLTSLEISGHATLAKLNCYSNQLTKLNVSNNIKLEYLNCSGNPLTTLDLSNSKALSVLYCGRNQLTSLDVSTNTELRILDCDNNQLTHLDVSRNVKLNHLLCRRNQLTSLDVNSNPVLTWLHCDYNQLTGLDVSNNPRVHDFGCTHNQLQTDALNDLFLTLNRDTQGKINISGNPGIYDCDSRIAKRKGWNIVVGIPDSIRNENRQFYFVSDADGYVNVRDYPTVQSDILYKLDNKSIVEQVSEKADGWIEVKGGYIIGYEGDRAIYSENGYIHKSRLSLLSGGLKENILTAGDKFFSNSHLRPACVLHKDIPHIIFFTDNDCELSIRDMIQGKELYYTCVPVCPYIHIESDTLWVSERGWMGGNYEEENDGVIADYKMIKEDNTFTMVCTRFYPTIPKMSKEEIDKALKNDPFEDGVGIRAYRLFVAYCNGSEEAKAMLTNTANFDLDGAAGHEYGDVMGLLRAYESNQNRQKRNLLKDNY